MERRAVLATERFLSVRVRNYRPSDEARLREMHSERCLPYKFPDIENPEFVAKIVVTDDEDNPIAAALARKTVEIYGLVDSSWESPAWRFEAMVRLHEAMRHEVGRMGYRDAHAWIPPQLVKSFARKLRHLFGWQADPWPSFCRKTGY